jgi:hypothetical protein
VAGSNSPVTFTLHGTNFASGAKVQVAYFGNGYTFVDTNTNATFVNSTTLTVPITTQVQADTWHVRVRNSDGQLSGQIDLVVTVTPPAPTLSSISPNPVAGSNSPVTFTLHGTNFVSGAKVQVAYFGNGYTFVDTNTNATFVNSTTLTVPITTQVQADTWHVRVRNPDGQLSGQIDLVVTTTPTPTPSPSAPTLSSISPNPVAGSNSPVTFTLHGTNFVSGAKVQVAYFGNGYTFVDTNTNATFVNSTTLTVPITTQVQADTWHVRVRNPDGQLSGQIDLVVTTTPTPTPGPSAPTLSAISPNPVTGSNSPITFTLNGTNFVSGAKVQVAYFGNGYTFVDTNTNATFVNSTTLTVPITTQVQADTWHVRVRNPDGQLSGQIDLVVTTTPTPTPGPSAPTLSSISPNPVAGSNSPVTFTLHGTNFVNGAKVQVAYFGNGYTFVDTNTNATFANSTTLTVPITTQVQADTWHVRVRNPDGQFSGQIDLVVTAPGNPTPTPAPTPSTTPSSGPVITAVSRQYPGVFLQGANVTNVFDVHVTWNGQPGSVNFNVNGTTIATEQGNAVGASHAFNMGSNFTASFAPIEMQIKAQNAAGQYSATNIQSICVLPYPTWLSEESAAGNVVRFFINSGDVRATFTADFPRPHLATAGPINIPAYVPFIDGQLGLIESFARLQGSVSSNDRSGLITLSGQTGFTAAGQTISGRVSGAGNISLECQNGLQLQSTTFQLTLAGNLRKEVGIADAIPELRILEGEPIIGELIRWFNSRATLSGEIEPSLDFTARFRQDGTGNLRFDDASGTLALALNATLQVNGGSDRLSARAWVGGRGSSTLLVPGETFVQNLNVTLEAGVALRLDYIFASLDWEKTVDYACSWAPGAGVTCGRTEAKPEVTKGSPFSVITPDYARFGPYAESFPLINSPSNQELRTRQHPNTSAATAGRTLVGNLFAGASPATIELANDRQLLLWVHADSSLPTTQATGIMWSMRDPQGNWTQPKLIASDTRAEFSPVAAVDTSGKVLAVWLRVKEADFPVSINAGGDMERFYRDFEVVGAEFDPGKLTWGEVTPITDDDAFDTDLKLSSDGGGGLLLSWLSNSRAKLMSTAASTSTLKYCLRDGNHWTAPMVLADSLVGVSKHAAAVRGEEMVVVVPRSQNGATNGGVIDAYRRNAGGWGAGTTFASGDVENRLPSVCYDSNGVVHVTWLRENDLVSATLDDPTPRLVRAASTGVGFYDARLVANRAGNLALIYEQVGQTGPGTLFGSIYFPATNTWGEGQQLIDEAQQSRDASAYFDLDGHLRVAYLSTEILRTSRTVIIDGVPTIIENLPDEGQTNLKTATVSGLSLFAPSALANISTRLNVGTDDDVLIGGFIITGTQPKRVMVRAVGPSLARFGLSNVLPDPTLELHDSNEVIATNDNWDDSANRQEIIDSTIEPIDPQESAILMVLVPGAYTAVVRDKNNSSGVGLVEVYDLDQTVDSKLANISTRGSVGTGNNVMIGGTIIVGSNPTRVLVRAIGPSLTQFGVPGALADPVLELHGPNGFVTITNNNWRDTQEAEIIATGISPSNNLESAILVNLPPGAYTAIVRGSGNSTGVAVVEAYQLQ